MKHFNEAPQPAADKKREEQEWEARKRLGAPPFDKAEEWRKGYEAGHRAAWDFKNREIELLEKDAKLAGQREMAEKIRKGIERKKSKFNNRKSQTLENKQIYTAVLNEITDDLLPKDTEDRPVVCPERCESYNYTGLCEHINQSGDETSK